MSNIIDDLRKKDNKSDKKLKKPRKWAVIFHNDPYTTMEFVNDMLMKYFRHTLESATKVMMQVHKEGKGVAGLYQFDVAETKAIEVKQEAKVREQPLMVTLELEENED